MGKAGTHMWTAPKPPMSPRGGQGKPGDGAGELWKLVRIEP